MPLATYNGIIFDSQEEAWFAMWCEQLRKAGLVASWEKITKEIQIIPPIEIKYIKKTELKTKTRHEEKRHVVLNDLGYTPDFLVRFTRAGFKLFCTRMTQDFDKKRYFVPSNLSEWADPVVYECYVEVKPTFDMHGKTARFAVLQKIIWYVRKLFVNLIIHEELFRDTFMPEEAAPDFKYKIKNKAGQWKTKYTPKTLSEYVKLSERKD